MIRRSIVTGVVVFAFVLGFGRFKTLSRVSAASADAAITLDAAGAGPRELEDQTQRSIVRDYDRAWGTLQSALERGDAGVLQEYFVGVAKDKLSQAITQQQKSGVRVRYQVRRHALKVLFYSPEGSAIEVRDTAQLTMQVLDGGKVVHSEELTQPYLVLFTPAEDRWKVRLLEPLPQ